MSTTRRPSRARRLVLAAGMVTALLASPGTAAAHGDQGRMQLEATATGALQAFVRATVIYENDSEPALGATVTVDATGPDGTIVPTTALAEAGDGRYEATLTFPTAGAWTLRATASDPAATGEVAFTAVDSAPPTTTVPEVEIAQPRRATTDADDDDEGSNLVAPIVAVVVLGVGAATGAWLLQRRRNR